MLFRTWWPGWCRKHTHTVRHRTVVILHVSHILTIDVDPFSPIPLSKIRTVGLPLSPQAPVLHLVTLAMIIYLVYSPSPLQHSCNA